jgi:thiol-disulfide isomerase/thioredoxin/outer membrane lipoprotein-sorting protein
MVGPALATVLLTFAVTGCEPAVSPDGAKISSNGESSPSSENEARELLTKMADTYAAAKTYEDVGELYYVTESNGQKEESPGYPYSVSFERPNKFRIHAYGVNILSDGKLIRATLPGIEQILTLPAPPKIALTDVLGDELLAKAASGGISSTPLPVIRLLIADHHLPGFDPGDRVSMLSDEKLGDITCKRVAATTREGEAVYWIDPETHLLQRMEFATAHILDSQKAQGGNVDSLKIWADFKSGRFNHEIEATAFEFEAPKNAQLVKRFLPPPPQPPSPLLGEEAGQFSFASFDDGGTVDRESLKGKVAVFDFWATWCGWCFRGMPNVEKVYNKFKDNKNVAIYAVDTDDERISDDDVKKSFAEAKLHVPIARDRNKFNESAFSVEGLPTMVVIDGNGIIQHVHVGFDPNLEKELTDVIERLLKGENLAKAALEKHAAERQKYEQEMNDALIGTTSSVELPESSIAEKSEPRTLKLEQRWNTSEIPLPGNLLVVGDDKAPAVYVLSGSQNIVQLNTAGELGGKFELEMPRELAVSSLRTAVDGAGKRCFAAFANTQQQVYLFDDAWKKLAAYPDSQHSGIADAQLSDLDGDGTPELLVGYWGVVGVQAASLTGQRIWSDRQLENVTKLAITDGDEPGSKRVLAVNGRDAITPITAAGKSGEPIPVAGTALYAIYAAELNGTPPMELCALSSGDLGALTAIGLDSAGKIQWAYPMPKGIHSQPVELVTPVTLPGSDGTPQGAWLLAGADGSLHFLAADGTPIDKFYYGAQITGVATATVGDQIQLIVATPKSVTAWQVSR